MDFSRMTDAFREVIRDVLIDIDPYGPLIGASNNAVEGRDMYGQWNNHSWSIYKVREDGSCVLDPRCPWCTQRKSTGHHYTCDRPQGRGR